ncbi:MAG: MMPL family transporter [Deltaproteobacteria bacterium]|nr:MMPL family transporter [Deltaproteobacteria bacterium]
MSGGRPLRFDPTQANGLQRLVAAWARLCAERRGLALLLLLLLSLGLGLPAGWQVIQNGAPVDFTPQAMFIDKGPEVAQLREAELHFGREDNDLVLIVRGAVATAEGAAYVAALHGALEGSPLVERVDSPHNAGLLTQVDGALTELRPGADSPGAVGLRALAEAPATRRLLVSEDLDTVAVRARIQRERRAVAELSPAVASLVAAAEAVPRPAGVELLLTGVPFVRTDVVARMNADQLRFFPLVAIIFAGTIVLLFRRVRLGLAPLLAVVVADLWAMAALVLAGTTFNLLSVLVPTLVIVIGAADGIHITTAYRELRVAGLDRAAALERTLPDMLLACWLTTFTTAAGFASLLVADTQVIRAFGFQSSIAMLITFLGVIFVLPALLAWVPEHRVVAPARASDGRVFAAIDRLTATRPGAVLLACVALSLGAAALGSQVQSNSRLLEMYPPGTETHRAVTTSQDELAGVIPMFFYMEGPPGALITPEALDRQRALEAALRAEPAVRWTSSPAGALDELHRALTGEGGGPQSREAAAQELLLAEMSGAAPLRGLLDEEQARGRVLALVRDDGGRSMLEARDRLVARAAEVMAGAPEQAVLTGDGLLAAIGVNGLIHDLLWGVVLVFGVVAATLVLVSRDLKMALLACIPNTLPLLFTLATLRLIGADLQTSNIVSFTVAVGLAVDDTIHFLVRYRSERAQGHGADEAIRRTILGAGDAIVFTSVLLVAGFGVLTLSELTSTKHFGLLSSVTMVAALAGDLLMLPALLHLMERGRARAQRAPAPGR